MRASAVLDVAFLGCVHAALIEDPRYETVRTEFVPFRQLDTQELIHKVTGARVLFLVPRSGTEERTFAVFFRTPGTDDKGIQHIIEHSVFEGSRKFPVMNSIQHLAKNSMSTYLNAYTAPIKTGYPISTINDQDLLNLATVYLDNVFDPLFVEDKVSFEREGWHYSLSDTDARLEYGGVVYNEMKGVFSNPRRLAGLKLTKEMYKNSSFEHYSGGVPSDITDLQFEDAVDYYYRHYHPANSYSYYYGSPDQLSDILDLLDDYSQGAHARFASKYGPTENDQIVQSTEIQQPDLSDIFTHSLEIHVPGQKEPETQELIMGSMQRLTSEVDDCTTTAVDLLSTLFASDKQAPLRRNFEKHGIASAISAGYDTSFPAINFRISLQGLKKDWLPTVENRTVSAQQWLEHEISKVTDQVLKDGFDPERIESMLTKLEFSVRRAEANPVEAGMGLMDEIMDAWIEKQEPLRGLRVTETMQCLRDRIQRNPNYLVSLLEEYHPLQDKRQAYVLAIEDKQVGRIRQLAEESKLTEVERNLSPSDREQLVTRTRELAKQVELGDSPEALATIPVLPLSSVPRAIQPRPYRVNPLPDTNIPLVLAEHPTGQIALVSMYVDLSHLTLAELHLLPLLNELLNYGPTQKHSAEKLRVLLDQNTGGLSFDWKLELYGEPGFVVDPYKALATGTLSFSCLQEKLGQCMDTVREVITNPPFDASAQQAKVFWRRKAQRVKDLALSDPRGATLSKIHSYVSLASAAQEQLNGLSSLEAVSETMREIEEDWGSVARKLEDIWRKILVKDRMAMLMTSDAVTIDLAIPELRTLVKSFPEPEVSGHESSAPEGSGPKKSGGHRGSWCMVHGRLYKKGKWVEEVGFEDLLSNHSIEEDINAGSQVKYNHQLIRLQSPGERSRIEWEIPIKALVDQHLVPTVRMIRGAYGVGAQYLSGQGYLALSSYRDPYKEETYATYREIPTVLGRLIDELTERDLNSYQIRKLSQGPQSSYRKGFDSFTYWARQIDDSYRQRQRDRLFNQTFDDFKSLKIKLQQTFDHAPVTGSVKVSLN